MWKTRNKNGIIPPANCWPNSPLQHPEVDFLGEVIFVINL